jgi:coproporphyrinogen III oxidase-like Fe-S oxidoreductase
MRTVVANPEITAHPDDLSTERILELQSKINRLSIGIQSFEDDLRMMVSTGGPKMFGRGDPSF